MSIDNVSFLTDQVVDFDAIKIGVASPEQILSWSFGEIEKPETINYRTFKPERGGLFCAKIFGPVKDYECLCGKYKRIKYRGLVCEKCGVEVTVAKVRRERMAHITLAAPVAHIWFLKSMPSKISTLLDMPLKDVEKVLYFEAHIVTDTGISDFELHSIITEDELHKAQDQYGVDTFTTMIGAEAVRYILENMNLQQIRKVLRDELLQGVSEVKKKRIAKRLKLVDEFIESSNKPEWMIMTVLPVIPPDIRPLVMLDGGRFATSDLNELYRRVINRNNRLKRLIELSAPDIIIRNEKRMLQEAVDALLDNGKRGKVLKNANKRPFKSISDMLKGKQGRFRQNLLGKRVDYSGRSVIVSGAQLKLHQCGLPKQMALELFKPFIYSKLILRGVAPTVKAAKKMVEMESPEVWDVLDSVIQGHPVLLNRAPTLHRLGIQAFEPVLIDGKAIQVHPLVCAAFNADFDGDQMAVHIPLSLEAQVEARVLMMSTNNILSPANGRPIILPDKDIVLGLYYLTHDIEGLEYNSYFGAMSEVHHALEAKVITLHTKIKYRIEEKNIDGELIRTIITTTPGRLILMEALPDHLAINFSMINKPMAKKDISGLVDAVYRKCGQQATVTFADKLLELGFKYATVSGVSFGMDDIVVPKTKAKHIESTQKEVNEFEQQYAEGLITHREKYNKAVDSWLHCTDKVANDMMKEISELKELPNPYDGKRKIYNSLYMMAISGARGSVAQMKQLAGMRGLMAKPSGEIIERPIISNFKEGLNVSEYFDSTHGARKGLADTALKTANSGYLTRRLVDVAQDCIVTHADCGSIDGIVIDPIMDGSEVVVSLADQILGRVSSVDVYHPVNKSMIVGAGQLIDEKVIDKITDAGIDTVKVRSVLTCLIEEGLCAKCYGRDLSNGKLVSIGEAVGVIAAQSIGEPGTQLTMRTFHIGGAITKGTESSFVDSQFDGIVRIIGKNIVLNSEQVQIVMSRSCEVVIVDEQGREKSKYKIPYGSKLLAADNARIKKGQRIAEWDPYTLSIISEKSGKVVFKDVIANVSVLDKFNEDTGVHTKVITETRHQAGRKEEIRPCILLVDNKGDPITLSNGLEARYYLPINSILNVFEGDYISSGDILARVPKESSKTKDITGGLPRVIELVEARKPKDHSIIVDFDGRIEFGKNYKTKRMVILHPGDHGEPVEYVIPKNKHILVSDGDFVRKGDIIVEGAPMLQDILRVMGIQALSRYMVSEIQTVYRLQGVKIDDKHIEIIIRQMIQKVEISDGADTTLLVGEKVHKGDLIDINRKAVDEGLRPAVGQLIIQGITRSSLQTKSFISAASFQETTKVLTDAAVAGKIDMLRGLKENVLVGRLIKAGTGLYARKVREEARLKYDIVKPL